MSAKTLALEEKTFAKTYAEFLKIPNNIDVISVKSETTKTTHKILRAEGKDFGIELENKPLVLNTLSTHIHNPYHILGFSDKTSVQKLIIKQLPQIPQYGAFAYSCSCGSGKTIAGISIMYKLQARTMIISSRNAIKDQWQTVIETLYPELIIETLEGQFRGGKKLKKKDRTIPDVLIYSPQYLTQSHRNKSGALIYNYMLIPYYPTLIIYDEIHSLLSEHYINVLTMPLERVINKTWNQLPIMIALSATFPPSTSLEFKRIQKIFGKPFRISSNITSIPVHVWDYRDHYTRTVKRMGKDGIREPITLSGQDALGYFDSSYEPLDDYDGIQFFINKLKEDGIEPDVNYKGIVITHNIDPSVYLALYIRKYMNCSVLLMRAVAEPSIFISMDVDTNTKEYSAMLRESITLADVKGKFTEGNYTDFVPRTAVIVGTDGRLKEGFSVQNIVWGICMKFPYSIICRIQILGRIRRNSDDPELNNKKRMFYVVSSRAPSTLGVPNLKFTPKYTYDFSTEDKMFKIENYIRE